MEDHNDQCVARSGMLVSVISSKNAEHIDATVGSPHKNLSGSFNISEQLAKTPDSFPHTIFGIGVGNSCDPNGNLVQGADGLGIQRQQSDDALNRRAQTIDGCNGVN